MAVHMAAYILISAHNTFLEKPSSGTLVVKRLET